MPASDFFFLKKYGFFVWQLYEKIIPLHSQTSNKGNALLAQLVEQLTLNQWVQGSSP